MVEEPAATPVARPLLFTVATPAFDEDQVDCAVISRLVASEYVPVAVNCWVFPTGTLAVAGVTAIEDKVTEVGTVRVAVSDFPWKVAVMIEVPAATAVARPLLLIVATDGVDEDQVTWTVIS